MARGTADHIAQELVAQELAHELIAYARNLGSDSLELKLRELAKMAGVRTLDEAAITEKRK
jgi:cell division protein ZapA (FtsZ GTPase activity inhibitor)